MTKRKFIHTSILVLTIVFASAIHANITRQSYQLTGEDSHWYLGGYAGTVFPQITGQRNLDYLGTQQAVGTFDTTGASNTARIGLVGGYTFSWHRRWFPRYRIGAELWRIADTQAKGTWTEKTFGTPFQQYDYRYSVGVTAIGLTAEVAIFAWHHFSPFIGIGLGNAWISSKDFHTLPASGVSRNIYFRQKKQSHIYYEGKVGISYRLSQHTTLRAWYAYDDLGKVSMGKGGYPESSFTIPDFKDKLRMQSVALSFIHTF